jgi:hypothetical protein
VWGQAWAATYYIDTSCEFNGNGTGGSGACAASGGAAGAYNTGASWVNGVGNTTYFKRGTTVSNLATIISSASQTFDDYGDASAPCPLIAKSGTTFTLSISAADVTINDLCISGSQSSALLNTSAARSIFNRLTVYSNGTLNGIGVRFNTGSSDGQLNDSLVYDMTDDGVGISNAATGTYTISNLTCHHIDTAASSGDCIQLYDSASASLVVTGGTYTRETGTKQAIRAWTSGSMTIRNVNIEMQAAGAQGISIDGTGELTITGSYIKGVSGTPNIFTHTSGTTNISGNVLVGNDYGIWSSHATGTLNAFNNSIRGQAITGIYHTTDGAGGTLNAYNNYIDAPTNINDAHASATTVADFNAYGPSDGNFVDHLGTYTTIASWRTASSQDANSTEGVDPGFIGGTSPTTAEGFHLTAGSALRRGGKDLNIGNVQDCENQAFNHPPDIGACGTNSGDAAAARTAR